LESWNLPKLKVNGRNTIEVATLFARAQTRLEAAQAAKNDPARKRRVPFAAALTA
jgi:hypothetical protein